MRVLAIETSCDETAVSIVEAEGNEQSARFSVLGNALLSQIEIHRQYGGVFPALAKREHAKNLVPILQAALEEAGMIREDTQAIPESLRNQIAETLSREPGLSEQFLEFIAETEPPPIDAIAVTSGPGLEPALWVGINFAKALSLAWNKPVVPVNHMEGHIMISLLRHGGIENVQLPLLALLISGGHTELVLMKNWLSYELVGQTRDDAVGEAFDKVARMLGLPYPGGPEISKLAEEARLINKENPYALPRPMIDSGTGDFSFAGLKTAVLYLLKNNEQLSDTQKRHVAHEFENAVTEVLWKKTSDALTTTGAKTLVLGGGVSANTHIRRVFAEKMMQYPEVHLMLPEPKLTTDNAVMIGLAGFYRAGRNNIPPEDIRADGNLSLA